ncbi:MAG: redox-regulated ATPase YchF, partial [Clostridia bacterium]|nr:redox-regulated ATPase YchF [Clostridia bacterium]
MKLGIVGLPNVGKSTLFNAITNAGAQSANYPFCTIEPNVGVVAVPDSRIDALAEMYSPAKITPAVIEFVDIAGLVKGASKGEGLGNKFLSHIREVDAIIHVVRCFENDDIIHVDGSVDPARDIETINLELIFSDIEMVERRIDRTAKAMKGDKSLAKEYEFLKRLKEHLEEGKSARSIDCDDDEKAIISDIALLTSKPVIYACNMSEDDFANNIESNARFNAVCAIAKEDESQVLPICAELEAEIASLDKEEKEMFLAELGVEKGGLDLLIQRSYDLLGLISYLTAGTPEVRAWT